VRLGAIMTDRSSDAGVALSPKPDVKANPKGAADARLDAKPDIEPAPEPGAEPAPEPPPESDLPPETAASDAAENHDRPSEEIDEDTLELRRSYLLRRFWHTAFRFWTTPGRRIARRCSSSFF
jgi:hypothetical protein